MKKIFSCPLGLVVFLAAGLLILSGCGSSQMGNSMESGGMAGHVVQAEKVSYQQIAPFVKMGAAWGDRGKGEHGTFGIFPGGAKSPLHTHSRAYHGIVISGVMTNPFGTEKNSTQMGKGSHWYVPAGEEHVTACVSAEPCRFYFHSEGGFDFAPVKQATHPRSRQAVSLSGDKVDFKRMAPFVSMGTGWGDRGKGAHGTFGIFEPNSASPPHTHSGAYHGVVLSGTMTNPFNGDSSPPKMTQGSYWYVPASSNHVTACVSKEPCRFYFHAEKAFDFHPAK